MKPARTVRATRPTFALVATSLALLLTGCTAPPAATTPSLTPTPEPTVSPVVYHSVAFSAQLTVAVDPVLNPVPIEDSAGLLTWAESGSDVNRIRFLVPAKVYGERGEFPVDDYNAYIQTLPSQGAVLSHKGTITVAGQTVPIVTVNEPGGFDGSIGCSSEDASPSDGDHCFAFGPDYSIRIVSLVENGKTFVAWARTDPHKTDAAFNAIFERMLATVAFQ